MTTATATVARDSATSTKLHGYGTQIGALQAGLETDLWAESPDVKAASHAREITPAATARLNELLLQTPTVAEIVQATYTRLLAGETVTAEEFSADLATASASTEARTAAAGITVQAADAARSTLELAKRRNSAAALRHLNTALRALVGMARPVLGIVDQVTGTGRYAEEGEAYAVLQQAIAAHARIRGLQRELSTHANMHTQPLVDQFGIIRDVRGCRPWVDDLATDDSWTTAPSIPAVLTDEAALRFVCRPDVQPWVPTVDEMLTERDAVQAETTDALYRRRNPGITDRHESDDPRPTVTGDWNVIRSRQARHASMPAVRLGDLAQYHSGHDDPDAA